MVEDVANFLGSPDVAIDERHGPMMYSRFLHGLLDTPLAHVDHSPAAIKRAQRALSHHASPPGDHGGDHEKPEVTTSETMSSTETHDQSAVPPTQEPHHYDSLGFDGQHAQSDTSEMYATPLPFDDDLLHSMQSLTDAHWSNMVLPGKPYLHMGSPDL